MNKRTLKNRSFSKWLKIKKTQQKLMWISGWTLISEWGELFSKVRKLMPRSAWSQSLLCPFNSRNWCKKDITVHSVEVHYAECQFQKRYVHTLHSRLQFSRGRGSQTPKFFIGSIKLIQNLGTGWKLCQNNLLLGWGVVIFRSKWLQSGLS